MKGKQIWFVEDIYVSMLLSKPSKILYSQCCHSFGFNLENCNRTDFSLFRLSLDFALAQAHVYCVTVHFDLSHCMCLAASAAGSSSSAGLQDNEQCEESDSSDSDGQSAQPPLIF